MGGSAATVNRNTPAVAVVDSRGSAICEIAYHRYPGKPEAAEARITRHDFDCRGVLVHSADPRLGKAGLANFTYQTDLAGHVLRTRSVDAGTSITLNDAASRPLISVNSIHTFDEDTEDFSQAVTQTWQYEGQSLPGRPLAVAEGVTGQPARVTERFVYASSTAANTNLNLVGQCIRHYDPAGLVAIGSVELTGAVLSTTRQLLKDAENPALQADWQGDDADAWNSLLAADSYTSLCTADATGSPHFTCDAAGHKQRLAYDLAGVLRASWLTVNGGSEQPIVTALTYSAMGQKLDELHGNGVVSRYRYDPQTQRLTGIRNERPAGHASGAKVLQDLHYQYDPVGNVLNVKNTAQPTTLFRNQKVAPQSTYVYDSLYQLASATGRQMAGDESANFTRYSRAYNYDNAGNLLQIRHSTADTANSSTTNITVSDRSNRAVQSTLAATPAEVEALFAAGGNQKQLQPGQMLAWTPRIELRSVTPVVRDGAPDDFESYRYDANRQRVLKTSAQQANGSLITKRALYLPGLELNTTRIGGRNREDLQVICSGQAGKAQVRVLHWENGKPLNVRNDQQRYSYCDLIGSSGLEMDAEGKIISLEEYFPYGATAVWATQSAIEVSYKTVRYSGQEQDETGLYYYGHRYYQPSLGRWLSADPAKTIDGLNMFCMVRNNPCSNIDVQGLMIQSVLGQLRTPNTPRITAQGLSQFEPHEKMQVEWALASVMEALIKVTEPGQPLFAAEMNTFFGPDYRQHRTDIIQSWEATKKVLIEYATTPTGHRKFHRASEGNSDTMAQVRKGDFEGNILILDEFFNPSGSTESQAATLIHEASHIKRAAGIKAIGVSTQDYFYLNDSDPSASSFRIVHEGKLRKKEVTDPAGLFNEVSDMHQFKIIRADAQSMHYTHRGTLNYLTLDGAVSKFNTTPLLRARVASKNADSLSYSVLKMASRM